jgi:hypothetical protein
MIRVPSGDVHKIREAEIIDEFVGLLSVRPEAKSVVDYPLPGRCMTVLDAITWAKCRAEDASQLLELGSEALTMFTVFNCLSRSTLRRTLSNG